MNKLELRMKSMKVAFMAALTAMLFVTASCGDDDDGGGTPAPTQNIVEIAQGNSNLTSLVAALVKFDDLVAALSGSGSFTVFAPTNGAFANLLTTLNYGSLDEVPEETLKQILQYHVLSTEIRAEDLADRQTSTTLLTGESLTFTLVNTVANINGTPLIDANIEATNGIVHVIDEVLVPESLLAPAGPTQNIVELAQGSADLSILVEALVKFDDLVAALSDADGNYTVFAPTNDAFAALLGVIGQTSLDDIPEDVLKRVLSYHVVAGTVAKSTDLTDGQMISTFLDGEEVTVSKGDNVQINASTVVTADVEGTNGVVHIVDAVLVPSLEASIVNTVVEPAYFNKDFSVLTAAVVQADLLGTLIDASANLTVFAPTNEAFAAAGITTLEGLTAENLAPILTYHVLGTEVLAADLPETGSAITTLGGDIYLSVNAQGVYLNGTTQVVTTDIEADNGVVHVIDRTLLPPSSNIVEIAVAASTATEGAEFGQLVAALTAIEGDASTAALVTVLSSMDGENNAPFTVFAPTDAAFEALYTAVGVADLDALVGALGTATIEQVLLYHVVPDARVFSTDLSNLTSPDVTMANGGAITLNLGDLTITDTDAALSVGTVDAGIIGTDILATNGVIHTIDQVILP